ncbi:MAG: FAD-dependent oxidoreductase, partial [Verrucomicrobiae bacterium]|nr:FAD-dependent oxidoreductase [Verrucomicrobiae bacterium]
MEAAADARQEPYCATPASGSCSRAMQLPNTEPLMKNRLFFSMFVSGAILTAPAWLSAGEVLQPGRSLPILHDVDVVVVGGGSAGVAAAVEAAQRGAKVFLAAPRPYLGEDICATYRLWLEPGEQATTDLAKTVFAPPPPGVAPGIGPRLPFQ